MQRSQQLRTPPALERVARLAHACVDLPVQVVAASPTAVRLVTAVPDDAPPVPASTARELARSDGLVTIDRAWSGARIGADRDGVCTVLCVQGEVGDPSVRAALEDLVALGDGALQADAAMREVEALRTLLGTASHDLRNPLAVLRAGLETLTLHGEDLPDGQGERIAELAVRQARRMETMINGLLALDGLEAQKLRREVDLRELLDEAVEAGRLAHEHAELDRSGCTPDGPVTIVGDPDALARMLTNLISNAATHGGGHVWVGCAVADETVTISVADDGPGMPQDSALQTGVRADRAGGHGLGLVIAQRIVEHHGGTISHHGRGSGGTVVEVTLPR